MSCLKYKQYEINFYAIDCICASIFFVILNFNMIRNIIGYISIKLFFCILISCLIQIIQIHIFVFC